MAMVFRAIKLAQVQTLGRLAQARGEARGGHLGPEGKAAGRFSEGAPQAWSSTSPRGTSSKPEGPPKASMPSPVRVAASAD